MGDVRETLAYVLSSALIAVGSFGLGILFGGVGVLDWQSMQELDAVVRYAEARAAADAGRSEFAHAGWYCGGPCTNRACRACWGGEGTNCITHAAGAL